MKNWSKEDNAEEQEAKEEAPKVEETEIDLLGMSPPSKTQPEPLKDDQSGKKKSTLPPPPGFKPLQQKQNTAPQIEQDTIDLLGGEMTGTSGAQPKTLSNTDLFSIDLLS